MRLSHFKIWLHYLRNAYRARKFYKQFDFYSRRELPCLRCVWEHEPEDTETPWHWIHCNRCNWNNQ